MGNIFSFFQKNFFGFIFTLVLAYISIFLSKLPFPPFTINNANPINSEIIAIVLGIIIGNLYSIPEKVSKGFHFIVKDLLALAIVFLGCKLHIKSIAESSQSIIAVDIFSILINIILGFYICYRFRIDKKLSTLLVMGNAICGSSAIIATAPLIKANQNQISLALVISSLVGLIAIFIYPIFGKIFAMNDFVFGMWSGSTVQSVPQVIATAFSYSEKAGETSTIVKLVKVLFLAPTLVLIVLMQKNQQEKDVEINKKFSNYFPPFIFGFMIMVALNSSNLLNIEFYNYKITNIMASLSSIFITMVMVAIGLRTNIKNFINIAISPLIATLLTSTIISILIATLLIINF